MTSPTFDTVQVGDALPAVQLPAVNRTTLALFAGASGDHNPIHIDIDFARRAGMPDVFWLKVSFSSERKVEKILELSSNARGRERSGHTRTCRRLSVSLM